MRILIVEDEIGIADFLKQGLEEELFIVDIAYEGNKGLSMALSGEYDILILDWMLPGKTGVEICIAFRKINQDTPIIFLTAKDTTLETIEGLESGANDYIKKPFNFGELITRIKVQLRSKSNKRSQLSIGDVILDIKSREVTLNGEEVHLTKTEFDLLFMLVKNKSNVCTRKNIIKEVWDIHFDYNTSVIDVYINALRKKINLKGEHNYIETVRGVGYIIKEI